MKRSNTIIMEEACTEYDEMFENVRLIKKNFLVNYGKVKFVQPVFCNQFFATSFLNVYSY